MAVADGVVYTGSALGPQSTSGEVVALDGATGARRWSARVGAPVGALVVTGEVVAGCWNILIQGPQPLVFGLDAADGRILWQRDVGPGPSVIAAADGRVFAAINGGLVAVDVLTGKQLWRHAPGGSLQTPSALDVSGDAVYAGYVNSAQAFSARTGQEIWSYQVDGLVAKVAGSGRTVYAAVDRAGPGYTLYALRG